MARERRTAEEVQALADKAKVLVDGGMSIEKATKDVGISRSIYDRRVLGKKYKHNKAAGRASTRAGRKAKKGNREHGTMDVRSLPPRPKRGHGGARKARPLDMMNMAALAARIASIDKKLAKVEVLQRDRDAFAKALMKLLNGKPGH